MQIKNSREKFKRFSRQRGRYTLLLLLLLPAARGGGRLFNKLKLREPACIRIVILFLQAPISIINSGGVEKKKILNRFARTNYHYYCQLLPTAWEFKSFNSIGERSKITRPFLVRQRQSDDVLCLRKFQNLSAGHNSVILSIFNSTSNATFSHVTAGQILPVQLKCTLIFFFYRQNRVILKG